jgi:regulator of RNase E activity RraA
MVGQYLDNLGDPKWRKGAVFENKLRDFHIYQLWDHPLFHLNSFKRDTGKEHQIGDKQHEVSVSG